MSSICSSRLDSSWLEVGGLFYTAVLFDILVLMTLKNLNAVMFSSPAFQTDCEVKVGVPKIHGRTTGNCLLQIGI